MVAGLGQVKGKAGLYEHFEPDMQRISFNYTWKRVNNQVFKPGMGICVAKFGSFSYNWRMNAVRSYRRNWRPCRVIHINTLKMEKKKRHKWEVQGHRWHHTKVCKNCGCTKNTSIINLTVYNKAGIEYFTSPNCE